MEKTPKPKDLVAEVDAWASEHTETNKCQTCNRFEHLLAAIERFYVRKREGTTAKSYADFHQNLLVPDGDYDLGAYALRNHVKHCVAPKYDGTKKS